ncbi:hypothetical protein [Cryptosporangium arvum]|uniref:Small secreted protein n=1 Tax=Cryptosporangium arvum DSM 44712 TaxID=927661 RepID=A0A011ABY1_9ACTN|nr:hypothetical protein [Cryptosporangium arvum]EXG79541.1 hypothetical protein CryarDRAFT_0582 [Cryptosporangium arvum DSM 44712]
MARLVPRFVGAALATAALAGTMGCSLIGADNTEACENIQTVVKEFTSSSVKNVDDPAALGESYHKLADDIRTEGAKGDGDLEDATKDLGAAYDKLGDKVSNLANDPNPSIPDSGEVTAAGVKFKQACE